MFIRIDLHFVIWFELPTDAFSKRQENFKRYFIENLFSESLNPANDSYTKVKQNQRRQQYPPKSTPAQNQRDISKNFN